MRKLSIIILILLAAAFGSVRADDPRQADYSIKQVMRKAHTQGLMKRVANDEAMAKEKKLLVDLYRALRENTPPKGSRASWRRKTDALLDAARAAAADDPVAGQMLTDAADCRACHDVHRD